LRRRRTTDRRGREDPISIYPLNNSSQPVSPSNSVRVVSDNQLDKIEENKERVITMILSQQGKRKSSWISGATLENFKIEFINVAGYEGIVDFSGEGSEEQILELVPASPASSIASSNDQLEPQHSSLVSDAPKPRKRARLDHLSAEQKSQHRKMMNRISAQSARDRQRAMMGQQEELVKSLSATVEQLKEENQNLRKCHELMAKEQITLKAILEENQGLKKSVENLEKKLKDLGEASILRKEEDSARSLVPAVPTYPQQKGLGLKLFLILHLMNICLRSILTLQNSSKLSKNSQKKSLVRTRSFMLLNRLLPQVIKELKSSTRPTPSQKKLKPPD